ncbi:MAG: ATP-dependent metallopeptidase FtsH/Yme1/Tma family protein, partial [Runella slithyformis]
MSENNGSPSNPNRNPRRTGYQGWIIAALVMSILGITLFSQNTTVRPINQKKFEKMVQAREVQSVTIVNNEFVEITLTQQAVQDPKYKALFADKPYFGGTGPHFRFEITSAEKFLDDFQKLKPASDPVDYNFDRRSDWTGFLSTWGFLIITILAMYFILGRMTGGGGPGGQIFNIGRSKATLFDAENKVKIMFNDVAGLEEAKEEIKEIVDYLKSPGKFTKLGAKIPKGALL